MEELIIDKEFKDLIPKMDMEEYARLTESLKEEGCRDAIVTWKNVIVDGHSRYGICMRYDISFQIVEKQFSDKEEAKRWIIFNQLSRRNLSDYDRIRLASQLREMFKARASVNQLSGLKQNQNAISNAVTEQSAISENYDTTSQNTTVTEIFPQRAIMPIKTRHEIAALAGVSDRTVDKFNTVEEKGTPELKLAASEEKVSLHTAAAIAELCEDEQKKALQLPEKEIVRKAKEVRQSKLSKYTDNEQKKIIATVYVSSEAGSVAEAAKQIRSEEAEIKDEVRRIASALAKLATDKKVTVEYMAGQLKDTINDISRIIDRITARN